MKRVMFICNRNAYRSPMAEGFARALGNGKITVSSAGLSSSQIDPLVIDVMAEVGIDVSQQSSQPLSNFNPQDYDAVISLCGCGANLPSAWVERKLFEDWQIDQPPEHSLESARLVRDQIQERVAKLVQVLSEPVGVQS